MPSYWRAHSRVRAERALDDARSHLEVEVVARQGAVRIRGSSSIHEIAEIQRVAQGVPGVVNLNLEEMVSLVRA